MRQSLRAAARLNIKYHKLPPLAREFFASQVKNAGRTLKGTRFSLEDKLFALSLYKQSPKSYRYLSTIFALPGPATLSKLLRQIPVRVGVLEEVFRHLEFRTPKMKMINKMCVLMFDEMSLQVHVDYCRYDDEVVGFVDDGTNRKKILADHVQVFMIRSIFGNWKQPVAYNFCSSSTAAADTVRLYKEIAKKCSDVGLEIVASVCDQGATNSKAIKMLLEETRGDILRGGREGSSNERDLYDNAIITGNQKIYHLFDPPHLLKCIRNNLLDKKLQFTFNGEKTRKVADWNHVIQSYQLDSDRPLRLMPKLTNQHVMPKEIKKMKVSACTQVFSHTVSACIFYFAECNFGNVPAEARQTAQLLKFFDTLFDSFNGGKTISQPMKVLRGPATSTSRHLQVWRSAIKTIESMSYIKSEGSKQKIKPEVLKNFVSTLRGFINIHHRLLGNEDITSFPTRRFNQDPIENFFGQIRQHGGRNVNPTCRAFQGYFKSLLVNNLSGVHSRTANCENDDTTELLENLKSFIVNPDFRKQLPPDNSPLPPIEISDSSLSSPIEECAVAHVSGWLSKNILAKFTKCNTCSKNLLLDPSEQHLHLHKFTELKEYDSSSPALKYCNKNFICTVTQIYNLCLLLFPKILHRRNLTASIRSLITPKISFTFAECSHVEALKTAILTSYISFLTFTYCNRLDNILARRQTDIQNPDELKRHCIEIVKKRSSFRK